MVTPSLPVSPKSDKRTNWVIIIVTQSGIVASEIVLLKGEKMTRGSIAEYTEALRGRYFRASKKEKGRILGEFASVTGYHRKVVIRLLRRANLPRTSKKRERPRLYSAPVVDALMVVWKATVRLCSKRLYPFLPELVKLLRRHDDKSITAEIEAELCPMSPSTIDRLLHPYRGLGGRHSFTATKPGRWLKSSIPIRTFADWQDARPGFVEADFVSHCGDSMEGFYLTSLSTVDVASGWVECAGVWGKARSGSALPFIGSENASPSPCYGCTQIIGASSSTSISIRIASERELPSPAPVPIRRMTAVTYSRRPGRWCGG